MSNCDYYKKQIETFKYRAMWHFLDHSCGAAFFKYAEKLFDTVERHHPKKILEIGTGIGYTSFVMKLAAPDAYIDSIEMELYHCKLAREYLKDFKNIEIHNGEAESVLPTLSNQKYDLVFYDGYAPRVSFLKFYESNLNKGGILVSANSYKKGSLTRDGSTPASYQELLQDRNKWKFVESFGDVLVYIKLF